MSALPASADKVRYALPAIALHWLIALLIIGMLCLGYYMADIPKSIPGRAVYFNLHKSLGVLAGALILLRLGWRLAYPPPAPPRGISRPMARAAQWSHGLLYLCMVLQPATGYLSSSFNKYGVRLFGLALPKWAWEDKHLRELFMAYHQLIAIAFIALIAIHVLAACKHVLIDRDRIFGRMLP
ncbi:cytochrome b561 [Collimonas sp. OK242]|uniref:cytochrome b n=1 Tax=Collimonas sp. OK242 TaxID=1798195 RepID=UPI00089B0E08|nr:cytochrome b [Collimonas sp. OK242]SDX07954.1 cytochrome b561 [Collimonas sp. OK242]